MPSQCFYYWPNVISRSPMLASHNMEEGHTMDFSPKIASA